MALPPMDSKGKNAIAVGVVLLLAVAGYWYVLWAPAQVSINLVAAHADTLEALNSKVKVEVANGLESKIKSDAERYTNELSGLRRLVPTENEVPALVEGISEAARAVGLEVSEFAPDGTLVGDDFDMVKYRFGVIGPYHKITEFLTTVASSPRIVTPINVVMTAPSRVIERKPKPNETFVEVKFGVMTYVAKTKPNAPAAPPAPAKAGAK